MANHSIGIYGTGYVMPDGSMQWLSKPWTESRATTEARLIPKMRNGYNLTILPDGIEFDTWHRAHHREFVGMRTRITWPESAAPENSK